MKNDYKVRACKFLNSIFPYIQDCLTDRYEVEKRVKLFNHDRRRNVKMEYGAVRVTLITSDYVVKWDYDFDCAQEYGGCMDEYRSYCRVKGSGYEHLLAESSMVEIKGNFFEIMPRISKIGYEAHNWCGIEDYLDYDEFNWVSDNCHDIHSYNWGIMNNKAVLVDYAFSSDVADRCGW